MLYLSEIRYQSDGELFFLDYTDQKIFNCATQTLSTSFFLKTAKYCRRICFIYTFLWVRATQ